MHSPPPTKNVQRPKPPPAPPRKRGPVVTFEFPGLAELRGGLEALQKIIERKTPSK